jgi:hypothetical protein
MTVSGVQAAGVALGCFGGEVSGCYSTPSVFDIWAMPEDGPPIDLQPRGGVSSGCNGGVGATFRPDLPQKRLRSKPHSRIALAS